MIAFKEEEEREESAVPVSEEFKVWFNNRMMLLLLLIQQPFRYQEKAVWKCRFFLEDLRAYWLREKRDEMFHLAFACLMGFLEEYPCVSKEDSLEAMNAINSIYEAFGMPFKVSGKDE